MLRIANLELCGEDLTLIVRDPSGLSKLDTYETEADGPKFCIITCWPSWQNTYRHVTSNASAGESECERKRYMTKCEC